MDGWANGGKDALMVLGVALVNDRERGLPGHSLRGERPGASLGHGMVSGRGKTEALQWIDIVG